jgi:hypothetical protein
MSRKKRIDEAAAFDQLRWERNYLRGLEPTPSENPTPAAAPTSPAPSAVPEAPQGAQPTFEELLQSPETGRRPRGKRSDKVTGLHVVLQAIKRDGFPHPATGGFVMVPRVMKALLSLEPVSVIQVVFEICEQTVGWADPAAEHGRREWARLSLRHFELACGMTTKQVTRGLKRAIQQGYILRRPRLDSFEYTIRWADSAGPNVQQDAR